jgi:hypothetical protein
MRGRTEAFYLAIPLVVLATIGIGGDPGSWPVPLKDAWMLLLNYPIVALPQIIWFGLARVMRPSLLHWHALFLAASATLIGLHVAFECCVSNSNALGWLYLYPASVASMFTAYCGCSLYNARRGYDA